MIELTEYWVLEDQSHVIHLGPLVYYCQGHGLLTVKEYKLYVLMLLLSPFVCCRLFFLLSKINTRLCTVPDSWY